ncbi:Na+/H+ antiporter NhaC family protein, partial [Thermodesulfobacteriota bacterium]
VVILLGIARGFSNLGDFAPLLPPLVAIALAFITHEILISLFVGIFLGSLMTYRVEGFLHFFQVLGKGFYKSVDTYILSGVADPDHVSIIMFTMMIGAIVALIAASGGLHGIVFKLARYARSSVLSQFYTWLMGLLIFFDDYANALIVGNTMRPITDRYRISREKLSFIVDATAAPVSSLVIVSTWIGYEVGLIQDAFKAQNVDLDPYMTFIYSLPYRFYVILMLLFIPILIFSKREMFSMYRAEKRARDTGDCLRPGTTPIAGEELRDMDLEGSVKPRALNAVIPICILIFGVLIGLWWTGRGAILEGGGQIALSGASLRDILGSSNSYQALLWASITASVVMIIMVVAQGTMSLKDAMGVWVNGMKSMLMAIVILCLAWGLGGVLRDIKTADCVAQLVSASVSVQALPLVIFIVSSVIAFATGTSWGSMAILFPISVPPVLQLSAGLPPDQASAVLYASIGSILSGTVFGDHCSPISDTTIMSSIASSIDHMDHVGTQLPYALLVGAVACVLGYLPAGFAFSPWLGILLGLLLLTGILFVRGRKVRNIN